MIARVALERIRLYAKGSAWLVSSQQLFDASNWEEIERTQCTGAVVKRRRFVGEVGCTANSHRSMHSEAKKGGHR